MLKYSRAREEVEIIKTPGIDSKYWFSCQIDRKTILQVQDTHRVTRALELNEVTGSFTERLLASYPGEARGFMSLTKTSTLQAFLTGGG